MNLIDQYKDSIIELCYVWIDEYMLIHKQGFNFSAKYCFEYNEESNQLTIELKGSYIMNFYSSNIISLTALVGKNGSGKSLIMKYLNSSLFSVNEKKIIIYRKNDEFHIIYSDLKKPLINENKHTIKYYNWDKDYSSSIERLEKNLGILNSAFYSNLFYDSNENANSAPYHISANISTGYLMRSKKSNKYVYRNNNIAQIEKFLKYDNLLMLQFLLNEKKYVDDLVLPPIKYLQFQIINNYFEDKQNEKRSIFLKSNVFDLEKNFNGHNDTNYEKIKERNKRFRNHLFDKLTSLNSNLENEKSKQKYFFRLNTIINLIYDFYCSIYSSSGLDREIDLHLYSLMNLNESFIESITIENVENKIKELFMSIEHYYSQIKEVYIKSDYDSNISEYKKEVQKTIDEIEKSYMLHWTESYINIEQIKIQVKKFLILVLKNLNYDIFSKEEDIQNTINKYMDNKTFKEIKQTDFSKLVTDILIYDYKEYEKNSKTDVIDKENIVTKKSEQIQSYIKFIDALSKLDSAWICIENSKRLVIELTEENITLLKSFIRLYYDMNSWGYYNFVWINGIDEDRRVLSSGEESMFKMYSRLYSILSDIDRDEIIKINKNNRNILILMDEPEIYLHPEWQTKLVSRLVEYFKEIFKEYMIQLIVTSNTPFLISDLPRENIILLEKMHNFKIQIHEYSIIKTFGQNIHTLLKDSFFMDTTIGEFSRRKINEVIELLNSEMQEISDQKEKIQKIIDIIGEPLIHNKLKEMLHSKLAIESEIQSIEKQINLLNAMKKELLKKESDSND